MRVQAGARSSLHEELSGVTWLLAKCRNSASPTHLLYFRVRTTLRQ